MLPDVETDYYQAKNLPGSNGFGGLTLDLILGIGRDVAKSWTEMEAANCEL